MTDSPFTAIGVDIGGTKLAAGIVTFPEGTIIARRTVPTRPTRGGEAVLGDVEWLVSELLAEAESAGLCIGGIGMGVCELVDASGHIVSAASFDWRRSEIVERLSSVARVVIEADVRAAALAEALFGAGCNASTFLYVSIGTGIASCLMIDGKPYLGARGAAGTMASGPLPGFVPELKRQELLPSLEQIAAGPALVARFNQLDGEARSCEEVVAAAAGGDAKAAEVLRSAAETLGGSIGWLVNVLDPSLVVLGGGLGCTNGIYGDSLIQSARRHIWWDGHRDLPIVRAKTGRDAGLLGAAATAWKRSNVA